MSEVTIYKVDKIEPNTNSRYIFVGNQNHVLNDLVDSYATSAVLRSTENPDETGDEIYEIGSKVMVFPQFEQNVGRCNQLNFAYLEVLDVKDIDEEIYEKIKSTLRTRSEAYVSKKSELDSEYESEKNKIKQQYIDSMNALESKKFKKVKSLLEPTLDDVVEETIF